MKWQINTLPSNTSQGISGDNSRGVVTSKKNRSKLADLDFQKMEMCGFRPGKVCSDKCKGGTVQPAQFAVDLCL